MSKIDLVDGDWVDLVFEGKNQAYGAYKLRKGTTKRNILAMISILAAAVLVFSIVAIKSVIEASRGKVDATQVTEISALNQPKKQAEVKQKPKVNTEPEKVVERVKSSVKFTAPVIKRDDQVKPEDEIKTQEEIMSTKTAIGALDVKGNDDAALMKFLSDNVKYPVVAQENGVQGRVVISFVVERDGSITDVKVARSVDPSLDREAARVVKSMPNWIPGKQNGSAVRVKYNVPVSFRLQ